MTAKKYAKMLVAKHLLPFGEPIDLEIAKENALKEIPQLLISRSGKTLNYWLKVMIEINNTKYNTTTI